MAGDPDQGVRVEAVRALGRSGRDAAPFLLQALEHQDPYVRREAVAALGPKADNTEIHRYLGKPSR